LTISSIFNIKNTALLDRWNPDAIVFNSWQHYGCPNYWMLHFFKDSSGAALHPSTIQLPNYDQLVTSAITWKNPHDGNTYLKIKVISLSLSLLLRNSALQIKMKKIITWQRKILLQVVNFGSKAVNLNISVTGLETDIQTFGSIKTVLTSGWLQDENSFQQPDKV